MKDGESQRVRILADMNKNKFYALAKGGEFSIAIEYRAAERNSLLVNLNLSFRSIPFLRLHY